MIPGRNHVERTEVLLGGGKAKTLKLLKPDTDRGQSEMDGGSERAISVMQK